MTTTLRSVPAFRRAALTLTLALLAAGWPAAAARQRLATISRYANRCDEYLVRGDAAVTASPVFKNGLRLAAWDGADPGDTTRVALASAVYFIEVPAYSRSVRIDVSYRRDPAATRPEAGFLFVRDPQVEEAFGGDADAPADNPLAIDPVFYGRTCPLPGNNSRASVEIGTDGLLSAQGILELHLAAGAGQVLDVDYFQVTAYADYLPAAEPVTQVVTIEQPYAYTYSYYYAGPWMSWAPGACTYYSFAYPTTPPFCFGGWWVWRSCFWNSHPWYYRPVSFTHCVPWPGPGGRPGPSPFFYGQPYGMMMLPNVARYRHDWYGRHFRVDANRISPEQFARDIRGRHHLLPPDQRPRFDRQTRDIRQRVADSDRELRRELGPKMAQQAARWRAQPRLARQELHDLQSRSPALRQSMQGLSSIPAPRPPTPLPAGLPPRPGGKAPAGAPPVTTQPPATGGGPGHAAQPAATMRPGSGPGTAEPAAGRTPTGGQSVHRPPTAPATLPAPAGRHPQPGTVEPLRNREPRTIPAGSPTLRPALERPPATPRSGTLQSPASQPPAVTPAPATVRPQRPHAGMSSIPATAAPAVERTPVAPRTATVQSRPQAVSAADNAPIVRHPAAASAPAPQAVPREVHHAPAFSPATARPAAVDRGGGTPARQRGEGGRSGNAPPAGLSGTSSSGSPAGGLPAGAFGNAPRHR